MTLEQSQQVLFHGLAFGNTDSIDLDNYKSHTTTPTNQAESCSVAAAELKNRESRVTNELLS